MQILFLKIFATNFGVHQWSLLVAITYLVDYSGVCITVTFHVPCPTFIIYNSTGRKSCPFFTVHLTALVNTVVDCWWLWCSQFQQQCFLMVAHQAAVSAHLVLPYSSSCEVCTYVLKGGGIQFMVMVLPEGCIIFFWWYVYTLGYGVVEVTCGDIPEVSTEPVTLWLPDSTFSTGLLSHCSIPLDSQHKLNSICISVILVYMYHIPSICYKYKFSYHFKISAFCYQPISMFSTVLITDTHVSVLVCSNV